MTALQPMPHPAPAGESASAPRSSTGPPHPPHPPQAPPPPASPPDYHAHALADQANQRLEQAEHRLDQMRQALGHSHRLTTLGTLAAVVAHEYHNLLTPVISYAQFALSEGQEDDPAMMRKALGRALAQAQDAAELSQTILSFARDEPALEVEGMPEVPHDHDNSPIDDRARAANLPHVIDQSLACLGRDPAKDGIEVRIDVPDLDAAMPAVSLQQVLVNLLLNSRKAMIAAGGRLVIYADPKDKWINLTVADTGPGIDPEEAEHLFEPFVTKRATARQNQAPTDNHTPSANPTFDQMCQGPPQPKGTGLGLCVCRELIHAVGGSIHLDSTPGEGAAFHMRLPRAERGKGAK